MLRAAVGGVGASCADKACEESEVVLGLLGMPLNGHNPRIPEHFGVALDSFYDVLRVKRTDDEPSTDYGDRLVVVALRVVILAHKSSDASPHYSLNPCGCELRRRGLMTLVTQHIRKVLVKAPAQDRIEHLGSTADAEQGQPARKSLAHQRELPSVSVRGGFVRRRMTLLAI